MTTITHEKKLANIINPNHNKPNFRMKPKPDPKNSVILTNNRSISNLILLSKTQNPSFFHSFNNRLGNFSNKTLINSNSERDKYHPNSEMVKRLARKKLTEDKESEYNNKNTLHFDISHLENKPYFKAPYKPLLNEWKNPNLLEAGNDKNSIDYKRLRTQIKTEESQRKLIFSRTTTRIKTEENEKKPIITQKSEKYLETFDLFENSTYKLEKNAKKFENSFENHNKHDKTRKTSENLQNEHHVKLSFKFPTYEEYLMALRKEIPSALSEHNPPSSRLELMLLRKWLDFSKQEIETKFPETHQMSQKKLVFSLVYQEFKRQMSCSCLETGQLLQDLWEYQEVLLMKEKADYERIKKTEIKSIMDTFIEKIKVLEGMCKEKDKILAEKQDLLEEFIIDGAAKGKNLLKSQENEFRLTKKLSEVRKIQGFLKKKLTWLTKENENLILKIEKKHYENSPVHVAEEPSDNEEEEDDEKILLDIKENDNPIEHNLQDLNQIIVSAIPEIKDIKHYLTQETEITREFPLRYQKEVFIQTDLSLMDKIYEKTMKNMECMDEMCQDYQYKNQIKDGNNKKFRSSVLMSNSSLLVKSRNDSFSGINNKKKSMIFQEIKENPAIFEPSEKIEEVPETEEIVKNVNEKITFEKTHKNEKFDLNSNYEENLKFSQNRKNSMKNKEQKSFEIQESINLITINNQDILPEIPEKSQANTPHISENGSIEASFISNESMQNIEDINSLNNVKNDADLNSLNILGSLVVNENIKDESHYKENLLMPSIKGIKNLPSSTKITSSTKIPEITKEIVRIRPSFNSIDLDFDRVIDMFKTENLKAQDFEDKYKRNLEMLQMENAHRKKLEAKNQELHKNMELLQAEIEKFKKFEENLRRMSIDKKRREKSLSKADNSMDSGKVVSPVKKKKALQKTLKREVSTRGMIPQFGRHVAIEYEHQKTNLGALVLEKIKYKKMSKFHNFMHLKLILKQIHMIYFERITQMKENPLIKEQDFASYTYSFFLSLFGLKKIADKRFIILILSIKKHLSFFRVNMFARFLGLLHPESYNYNIDELNKYNEALDFICNTSVMGTSISNNESDTKFYIPYIRAIQYTGLFGDTRMTVEENNDLKREIESFKENDPKNINKSGIIDFDIFMEKILTKYKILVNRAKTYVINAFAACDLDGNQMCNLQEFLLLNRHIESNTFDEEKLEKIFLENADIEKNGEKNLSFDKFSVVSVEYNLFTDEAQDKYIGITKKIQIEIKMGELIEVWPSKIVEINKRFEGLTILSQEEIENWKQIISVLDNRIMGKIQAELKPTLIAYMILEKESERLVEAQKNYVEEDEDDFDDEFPSFDADEEKMLDIKF